jgi:signal transduction histidine kinase
MSITAKTTLALLILFVALLGGASIILEYAVRPRFEQLEAASHERDLTRLEENLRAAAGDMTSRVNDYAHWDDTYAFVATGARSFITSNFSGDWLNEYGADFALFADDNGRVLWTGQRGRQASLVLAAQFLSEPVPANGAPISGVLWSSNGPMIFGAARATRSDGTGTPRGLVVIARRLDASTLRQQLQLDLHFIKAGASSHDLSVRMADLGERRRSVWRTDGRQFGLIPLMDGRRVVGAVLAEGPRDLSALGARTVATTLGLLALMFACALGALWLLLDRMVVGRLANMRHHFQNQAEDATPIEHDASSDEIGKLTDAYNALAARLREAVDGKQRALLEREAAAAANRMKSDFLANISHELRTPLNAVIGYAELIDEDLAASGVASAREDLNRITGSARHLLTLINEILDLSRIEGDRLEIRPEAFRVDELMTGVVQAAKPLAHAQGNVLLLEFDNDLGVAYNDHIRLRQSLINVLAHACKRTHSSAVRLRAERRAGVRGDELRFTIIDGGAKLSPAEIDDLFELFVRTGESASSGARLGLAVTRKLLTLMGGRIEVRNNTTGGCAFVVTVPAAACDGAPSQAAA